MKTRTLLITGNGLDIKSGLKSRYDNFFRQKKTMINDLYFYEEIYNTLFEGIADKNSKDFYLDLFKYCKPIYWLEKWFLFSIVKQDHEHFNPNVYQFFNHIENILEDSDFSYWILPDVMKKDISKNWHGVEGAMLSYVKEINSGNELMNNFNELKDIFKIGYFSEDKKVNINFNLFMIIADHIFKAKKKIINNKNIQLKELSKNELEKKLKDEFCKSIVNVDLNEFLTSELNKLENIFADYLSYEVERGGYKDEVIKNIYNLVGAESVNILNFNYTDYSNYIKHSNKEYMVNVNKVFNIHGSLNDHIIFGIDNDSENEGNDNINISMFTKTYRIMSRTLKHKKNESNEDIDKFDISYLADQSYDVIKFFGHSLSDADYSYFQSIFDKLDLYNSDVALEFYYSKHGTNEVYPDKDMHKVENNVFSLLSKYGGTLDNKSRGNNLMHKLLVEGRLVIKELK